MNDIAEDPTLTEVDVDRDFSPDGFKIVKKGKQKLDAETIARGKELGCIGGKKAPAPAAAGK